MGRAQFGPRGSEFRKILPDDLARPSVPLLRHRFRSSLRIGPIPGHKENP